MLHLAVAVPELATLVDQDTIGPLYYDRHFTPTPIQYRDGCAIVPEAPGWGLDFDPSA
jgi:muconate cycloisomerase